MAEIRIRKGKIMKESVSMVEAHIEKPIKECTWELIKEKVDVLLKNIIKKADKNIKIYTGRSNNPCRREKEHIRRGNPGAKWLLVLCCSHDFNKIKGLEIKLTEYIENKVKRINRKERQIKIVNRRKGGGSKGQPPYWIYIGLSENLFGYSDNCEKVLKSKQEECLS